MIGRWSSTKKGQSAVGFWVTLSGRGGIQQAVDRVPNMPAEANYTYYLLLYGNSSMLDLSGEPALV